VLEIQSGRREVRIKHKHKVSEHYGLHAFQMDSTVCIFLLVSAVAEVLAAPPASQADEARKRRQVALGRGHTILTSRELM
jgi:hypothetical protein